MLNLWLCVEYNLLGKRCMLWFYKPKSLYWETLPVSISYRILYSPANSTRFIINMRACVFWWDSFTVSGVDPHRATWLWTNQMTAWMHACWTLTPLCAGHSAVLRWLVEEPEVGVSPFSRGLMGSVGVLSVVCSMRFEVLCRSTKAGPSAPLVSPPSSLRRWTSLHWKLEWTQLGRRQTTQSMLLPKSRWDRTW